MRVSLLLFPLLVLAGASAFAAGEVRITGRVGLSGLPGYEEEEGKDDSFSFTESGWICGYYKREGRASIPWIMNPADGVTRRVGLLPGAGWESPDSVELTWVTDSGSVRGVSHYSTAPGGVDIPVAWIADGVTGATVRAGLSASDQPPRAGAPISNIRQGTENGRFAWGVTNTPGGEPPPVGEALWVMDCRTGAVSRAGLQDPSAGWRESVAEKLTESGWLTGTSARGNGSPARDPWVAGAATGITRRAGLSALDPSWESDAVVWTAESGLLAGNAAASPAGGSPRSAAWIMEAATGAVRRIGLREGAAYTAPATGAHWSEVTFLTETGWATGSTKLRREDGSEFGRAAWVQDVQERGGGVRRVGLFEGEEYDTRQGRFSGPQYLTASGWVAGISFVRGGEDGDGGGVSWVADAATGATRKVGLTGGAYANLRGESSGYLLGVTESGWVTGWSPVYADGSGVVTGNHAVTAAHWVADAATGVTWRVGLTGPEFRSSSGRYAEYIERVTEGGKVFGGATFWRGEDTTGGAVWVTDAATGVVTRIGLTGEEFTGPDNEQSSEINQITESGYALGVSAEYWRTEYRPSPTWVADARTGQTRRLGLVGGVTPVEPLKVTEGGLVTGYTERPFHGGATAWVVDMKTGRETTFDLSLRESTGYSYSRIAGVTPGGVVYGYYTLFEGEANLDARPFLWAEGMGTLLPDLPIPDPGPGVPAAYDEFYPYTVKDQGLVIFGARYNDRREGHILLGKFSASGDPGGGVRLTDLARLPDGKFRLSFSTDAAVRITLQSSTDLTAWTDAQTVDAPAGASHMDVEANPAAAPNRYWRLKTAPASAP